MAAPNEMTCKHLLRLMGTPQAPVIVDVCIDADFVEDPSVIPDALRWSHSEIDGLVALLAGRPCVVVRQKGLKLSQGLMSRLRGRVRDAQYLSGGIYGWRDSDGMIRIPATALPDPGLYVTRHRPKIDRIACPWLIRRFVDPAARFLFVAPAEVTGVAEKFNAIPFDVEDVHFSHDGPNCTFDKMLVEFALTSPALARLATVVRAADTNCHDQSPQAAGLLAFSVGLSRLYKDDLQQLEAGMALYDAFYRWARDGVDEGHDWPADRKT